MIEKAYLLAERLGWPLWCEDEAGPYQTIPHPGSSWQEETRPASHDHQYIRGKTCKLLTLFRPATGALRAEPVDQSTNAILHPWLKRELAAIRKRLSTRSSAGSRGAALARLGPVSCRRAIGSAAPSLAHAAHFGSSGRPFQSRFRAVVP